jgi:hypothetical protein
MKLDINKITIEPALDYYDRADIDTVLSRCHPLGVKKTIGKRICYSASYRGEWIAVLVFDAPVDRNKLRESVIGWNKNQVVERRKHIANNSRFAVVPKFKGVKNLASKILSLVATRISKDWMELYGIPLLALETYVDPEYNNNSGACYEAAGWKNLGYSSGYEKHNGERTHSKWYFLKPLHKDSYKALCSDIPHALITGVKEVSGASNNNYVLDAAKLDVSELRKDLEEIKDHRNRQGLVYDFIPLLSLCISAVVSGYTQYNQIADWIKSIPAEDRKRFGMPANRCPDERTISNFISGIEPNKLKEVLTNWLLKTYDKEPKSRKVVSIDGKAQRATSSNASEQKSFLNVFANDLGIVIEQVQTKKGAGELASAKAVIDVLEDKIVLADALHTDEDFINELEKKTLRTSSLSKIIINS